ncbi:MAG TPA: GGDEF domain-containing protein [Stellaceae bacterium]|nr:GGDEF domain-containing protein [Stellaceae bacterium]
MEIRDTKSLSSIAAVKRAVRREASGAPAAAGIEETVSLAGIPEAEMTPRVRRAIMGLLGEVDRLRRELEDSRNRIAFLERLADEDSLMPIANRRAFVRELSRMMGFAQRYGTPSSIVYFDLNGLKAINDQCGHAAGDAALQHVAQILVDSVRNTDVVGRIGGDEFGVLLVQTDEETARRKADVLAAAIAARPLPWQGKEIALSAAYGTYSFSGGENAADALDAADRAMYMLKKQQRSQAKG